MERRQRISLVALLVSVVGLSSCSSASVEGPCTGDEKRFCKDVEPGGGRLLQCLQEHQAELSDTCKLSLKAAKIPAQAQGGGELQMCEGDRDKFCTGVQPGDWRILKCLQAHEQGLSDACRKSLEAARARGQVQAGGGLLPCEGDRDKFCMGVQPGEWRILKCLKEHEPNLSSGCRIALAGKAIAPLGVR
jgi:hypothetical protein